MPLGQDMVYLQRLRGAPPRRFCHNQNTRMMHTKEELRAAVEAYLSSLSYTRPPVELYSPISYTLALGGKRLRPVMALMACEAYCGDIERALPLAGALELYHNHTLLHDDVMDKADLRRGKPTVHAKWGDNAAILSGDVMLLLAYKTLGGLPAGQLELVMPAFTAMAVEICEGQQLDMEFETRDDVTVDDYLGMTRLKTAVFFATALRCGAMLGGAGEDDCRALYELGINFGLAFQLQDDYLDVYGDTELFGKNIGGDIFCNKKTFLLITAMNNALPSDRETMAQWMARETFDTDEKVAAFKTIYERANVRRDTEEKIGAYFTKAEECLSSLSLPAEKVQVLRDLLLQSTIHRSR